MLQTDLGNYSMLRDIGLAKTAVACYVMLLKKGSAGVPELAQRLKLPRTGLYRVLAKLELQGFVTSQKVAGQAVSFQARPLDTALEHYFAFQRQAVTLLSRQPLPKAMAKSRAKSQAGQMTVLTGRNEIFDTYVRLAGRARQDLLTISIGEEVPEAIYELAEAASSRGVKQYLLFQRHTPGNDYWIKRWRAYGCHVRLIEGSGYHLNIIDNQYAILSSSNPDNTSERTAVLIEVPAIVNELRKYFFAQWRTSRKLGKIGIHNGPRMQLL